MLPYLIKPSFGVSNRSRTFRATVARLPYTKAVADITVTLKQAGVLQLRFRKALALVSSMDRQVGTVAGKRVLEHLWSLLRLCTLFNIRRLRTAQSSEPHASSGTLPQYRWLSSQQCQCQVLHQRHYRLCCWSCCSVDVTVLDWGGNRHAQAV